ncbi:MAG: hypothetical protein EHM35_00570 [Planctomycetaceae bacterium]|nr:MAG: hypothetical protein EHM35_00570 [Planctomycetaceae bacterium]
MGWARTIYDDDGIAVQVGSSDWRYCLIRIMDGEYTIRLTAGQARRLIPVLEKAAAECEEENKKHG